MTLDCLWASSLRTQAVLECQIRIRFRTRHLLRLVFVIPDFHKIRCPPFNWHLQANDVLVKLVHVVDQQSRHHSVQQLDWALQ